ncbi:MAG: PIG-L family deacetylase [Cyclobacteriaceae bacterium]
MAHDDDMVSAAGTMTMLCKNGWQVREMCFYQQSGLYAKKDSLKNPIRKKSLATVGEIQGLEGVDPVDFNFRNDTQNESPYMPMAYTDFPKNYKMDSLEKVIGTYIEKHRPTVIFTLDNAIGGYGNPDHVIVSQLILKYCQKHKADSGLSVKKIYQTVFTPSLAERVMHNLPVYDSAKKIYACSGMPLPNVQINFYRFAAQKKEAMTAYTTEQNSIKKFWPYYNWYPSWIYFRIFDKDFFRIIDIDSL